LTFRTVTRRLLSSKPNSTYLRPHSSTWAAGTTGISPNNNQPHIIMNIRFKDYTITRSDERNLVVHRDHEVVASKDSKEHKKGETFTSQKFVGYYPDVFAALRGIYRREAGKGCEDIMNLAEHCQSLVDELKEVVS